MLCVDAVSVGFVIHVLTQQPSRVVERTEELAFTKQMDDMSLFGILALCIDCEFIFERYFCHYILIY